MRSGIKFSRYAYAAIAALFVLGILVQVFLVGLSLLGRRPVWDIHITTGHTLAAAPLLMLILAYTGRVPHPLKPLTWLALGVYVLLADIVIFMRQSAPLVAALHPVLAVLLFGIVGFLAVRAWGVAQYTTSEHPSISAIPEKISETPGTKAVVPVPFMKLAGWCAYASTLVAFVGVVFFILLYIGLFSNNRGLQRFGTLNDICIIIQYLLILPMVLSLHHIIHPTAPRLSNLATLMALCGILVIVVFQILFVAGLMEFDVQVWFASTGIFLIGGWILIADYQLQAIGKLPRGFLIRTLAFFYFGYPLWTYRIGRLLLSDDFAREPTPYQKETAEPSSLS